MKKNEKPAASADPTHGGKIISLYEYRRKKRREQRERENEILRSAFSGVPFP